MNRLEPVRTLKYPLTRHPWLRGTYRDIVIVVQHLMGMKQISGVSSILQWGLDFITRTAKRAREWLAGMPPDEKKQVIQSASSVMVNYTKDLIGRIQYLANMYNAPGKYIKLGEKGNHVKILQQILNELHIAKPPLKVDGIYGPKTMAAVKNLQSKLGVRVDGYFGYYTAQALKNYVEKQTESSSWWARLADIVIPLVVVSGNNTEVQENIDKYVKQSVTHGVPVAPGIPVKKAEEKTNMAKWLIIGGLIILTLILWRKK